MNALRYRLQGVRLPNGQVSLQAKNQNSNPDGVVAKPIIDAIVSSSSVTAEGTRRRLEG